MSRRHACDSRCHSSSSRSAGSSRGSQPGWARRTSSWWTKNSSVLTGGVQAGQRAVRRRRGRADQVDQLRVGVLGLQRAAAPWRCSRPAARSAMPGMASSRRSRSTRWAARSAVVQPVAERRARPGRAGRAGRRARRVRCERGSPSAYSRPPPESRRCHRAAVNNGQYLIVRSTERSDLLERKHHRVASKVTSAVMRQGLRVLGVAIRTEQAVFTVAVAGQRRSTAA